MQHCSFGFAVLQSCSYCIRLNCGVFTIMIKYTLIYSNALYFTVLHCDALAYTVLHCSELDYCLIFPRPNIQTNLSFIIFKSILLEQFWSHYMFRRCCPVHVCRLTEGCLQIIMRAVARNPVATGDRKCYKSQCIYPIVISAPPSDTT